MLKVIIEVFIVNKFYSIKKSGFINNIFSVNIKEKKITSNKSIFVHNKSKDQFSFKYLNKTVFSSILFKNRAICFSFIYFFLCYFFSIPQRVINVVWFYEVKKIY